MLPLLAGAGQSGNFQMDVLHDWTRYSWIVSMGFVLRIVMHAEVFPEDWFSFNDLIRDVELS